MYIEFYVFEKVDNRQIYVSLCHLIEKWYDKQLRVAIVCSTRETLNSLDQLLWTFKDQSFIPHSNAAEKTPSAVLLCQGLADLNDKVDVLVNLSAEPIDPSIPKELLVEIVFPDQTMQQLARERYKFYRNQGHQLKTIKHVEEVFV